MAGTIRGSIEHLFLGAGQGTGSVQTFFVNLYNFLNNNTGTIGLQRIAYNTGSTSTGAPAIRGMNYYNVANPAGDNAWACFCFSSASKPWYFFMQYTGGTAFGNSPGSPALYYGTATTAASIGFAVAQRADGGNPWNGSSASLGYDTKGTPVWHPGTSSLYLFPRSNDAIRGGSHGTNRQNTIGQAFSIATDYRAHFIADYDNLAILLDLSNDNSYTAFVACQYSPLSGVNPDSRMVCISSTTTLPFVAVSVYGDTAGTTNQQGSIGYPTLSVSGTCMTAVDRYGAAFFQNTNAQPNRAFAQNRFDEWPILVGIYESPNQMGAMGQIYDFAREIYNVASHDTNADGTRAAFGTTTVAAIKLTLPWHSGTVPGSGATVAGTQFGLL